MKLIYTLDKSSLLKTVDELSAQITKNLKIEKISVDTGKLNSSVDGALKIIKDITSNSLKSMVAVIGTVFHLPMQPQTLVGLIFAVCPFLLNMPMESLAVLCTS